MSPILLAKRFLFLAAPPTQRTVFVDAENEEIP